MTTTTDAFVVGGPNIAHRSAFIASSSSSVSKATSALRSTIEGTTSSSSSSSSETSELVEEAMRITKQYGARSMEARIAWETVEEVRAADNSEAMKGSMIDHCFVDLDAAACDEFSTRMNELKRLIETTGPIMSVDSRAEQAPDVDIASSRKPTPSITTTTTTTTTIFCTRMNELKRLIETTGPIMSVDSRVEQAPDVDIASSRKPTPSITTTTTTTTATVKKDSDIEDARKVLKAAIDEAEQATNEHGIRSANAQVAWDHVEEIAAAIGHLHAQ
eukprot:CAMPEP_0113478006 /NCGR_PEP_ID=MMETSP0014_2-20120614/20511_1 /TAXON_ID=2857 /ORGANISM="Nitzschia sp." /LENGTH=274 /DNA_ID=CAMNT_0000371139 /DNA_START=522 /DNA_END=1346 /DNA_ORIENTATION=- /assembly_acc=CAM_ASM_000159